MKSQHFTKTFNEGLFFFFSSIVAALMIGAFLRFDPTILDEIPGTYIESLFAALTGLLYWMLFRWYEPGSTPLNYWRLSPTNEIENPILSWQRSCTICSLALLVYLLGYSVLELISKFFGYFETSKWNILIQNANFSELIVLFIPIVILTPIAIEFTFRGLLFRRLQASMQWQTALLFSCVILTIIFTLDPEGLPINLWRVLFFTAIFKYTGRLECAMIVHVLANLVIFLSIAIQ